MVHRGLEWEIRIERIVGREKMDGGEDFFETFFEQVVRLLEAVEAADHFYPFAC